MSPAPTTGKNLVRVAAYTLYHPDAIGMNEGDTVRVNARYVPRLSTALRDVALANFSAVPSGLNLPVVLGKIVS